MIELALWQNEIKQKTLCLSNTTTSVAIFFLFEISTKKEHNELHPSKTYTIKCSKFTARCIADILTIFLKRKNMCHG